MVSEDRRADQIFPGRSVRENLTSTVLGSLKIGFGFMSPARQRERAEELTREYGVRHPGVEAPMVALSGGNQQKCVIARWLATDPAIIILDEPTKGIDVGAKAEIHRLISKLAASGLSVLLISSDLPELLAHLAPHPGDAQGPDRRPTRPQPVRSGESRAHGFDGTGGMIASCGLSIPANSITRPWRSASVAPGSSACSAIRLSLCWCIVTIVFASVSKPFFTLANLSNVLLQASATAIAAVGMTFVIIIGEIDISIGSLMSLAMTVGWMAGVGFGAIGLEGAGANLARCGRSTPGSIRSDC